MEVWLTFAFLASTVSAQQPVTKPVDAGSSRPASSTASPVQSPAGATQTTLQTPGDPAVAQTGAVPAAVSADAPPPASSNSYVIGTEDMLQITVWKEASLSGTLPVRPDGMISLALIGDLPASGFTPMTLSMDIAAKLKKYINDPSVNVTVMAVHAKQVYLLGEVAHIGPIAITPEMTPLQAISAAGGLTPYANSKKIYILRGQQGKQQKIVFDYKKAIKDGNQQGVTLMPGDTIVVP